MLWIALAVIAAVAGVAGVMWARQREADREFAANSVDAAVLRSLMDPEPRRVLLYDVRQPLDLLAYSEMIPGAVRVAPKELEGNPELIPRDADVVLYCTCDGQKTSLGILRKARSLGYSRLKVLRGGLAGWKAMGFPVEAFRESFRLDTAV